MKPIRVLGIAAVFFVQLATAWAADPGSSPDQGAVRVEKDVAYLDAERAAKAERLVSSLIPHTSERSAARRAGT